MIEKGKPVSLVELSGLRLQFQEEMPDKQVGLLHAPLPDDTIFEIGKEMVVYES
ncbi:MAG: hypothetical protein IJ733_12540 [Lachnospiraceae bacterium]|nr:hypothetical protein [Lachnospiraceae bacterium]